MSPPTVTHRRFCPRGGHTAPGVFGFLISRKSSELSAVSNSHPAEQLRPIRPGLAHLGDAGKHQQWTMDLESDPEYARIKQYLLMLIINQITCFSLSEPHFTETCRRKMLGHQWSKRIIIQWLNPASQFFCWKHAVIPIKKNHITNFCKPTKCIILDNNHNGFISYPISPQHHSLEFP